MGVTEGEEFEGAFPAYRRARGEKTLTAPSYFSILFTNDGNPALRGGAAVPQSMSYRIRGLRTRGWGTLEILECDGEFGE